MNNSVYIVAKAKNDKAWEEWEKVRNSLINAGLVPRVSPRKDWKKVTRDRHCIRNTKDEFKWDGENNDDNKPFLYLVNETDLPQISWQCTLGGRTFHSIGSKSGDWRPFYCHSGQEGNEENGNTLKGQHAFWINPVVLHFSLHESNETLNGFFRSLFDGRLFDVKVIPDWNDFDYCRYLCKNLLRKMHEEHKLDLPDSIVRKVYFPSDDTLDSALFEILDRLGGFFYVENFGSEKPVISFCPPPMSDLLPLAESLGKYICGQVKFEWQKRETLPKPLPAPQEWRRVNVDVEDSGNWDDVFKAIEDQFSCHYDAWKESIVFIDFFRKLGEKVEERLNFLLPDSNGIIDVVRFIERFAEHFVVPQTPLLFEFPGNDFIDEQNVNAQTYDQFRKQWSFDLVKSQLGGAGTFFRRLLMTHVEAKASPDTRHRFMWQYNWHDALWFCNANIRFRINDKGNSSRLGRFHIGYSCLGANDVPNCEQLSQILFAPVIR